MKICIVTPDLLGPVRNGGIGTANTNLSQFLAQEGHEVTVLFSQVGTPARETDAWCETYRKLGIDVHIIEEWRLPRAREVTYPHHPNLHMAYSVFCWLAEQKWDLIVLTEWQGHGFYALQAKRTGFAFVDTTFITQIHSPSIWHSTNNGELTSDPMHVITHFIERKSVELTDILISPSRYMLDWVRQHGFRPPRHASVIPNLIDADSPAAALPQGRHVDIDELVFFGRLEYRKGLKQFCDALDRLVKQNVRPSQITFLGKYARIENRHAALYIAQRSATWGIRVNILSRKNQAEAIAYLKNGRRLAVMPSVADNSPYTVYECLSDSIPFVARDVGGVSELIAQQFHGDCLFNDNPRQLCELFVRVLSHGAVVPELAFSIDALRDRWRGVLQDLPTVSNTKHFGLTPNPQVSVCLVHYNRPRLLRQAVNSLMAQNYANFEVILVDDGSDTHEAHALLAELAPEFATRRWQIVRLENGYLGRARNRAAALASGEYLLFMDDDNVAKPDMISSFAKAAVHSDAELITAVFEVFAGNVPPTTETTVTERYLPLGDCAAFSVIANAIGDANSLIKKSLFERLGGFTEDYGIGHEDFELYLRAVLQGATVAVCPIPLFWYRRNETSMLSSTNQLANRLRSFRPFMDALSAPLAELALMSLGLTYTPSWEKHGLPLYLSLEEKRAIEEGDPDAPETVIAVAKALLEQGSPDMAISLLDELDQEYKTKHPDIILAAKFQSKLAEAIRGESSAHCENLITEVVNSNLSDAHKASLMRVTGRLIRTSSPKSPFLAKLTADSITHYAQPLDAISWQLSAELYLAANDIEHAAIMFHKWIACSEHGYLVQRNDVALAVRTGGLSSGLQHYHLHGRHENAVWPNRSEQRAFIVELAKKIQADNYVASAQSPLNQLHLALAALLQ